MARNALGLVLLLTLVTVVGCTLNRTQLKPENVLPRIGGDGQLIEPKRCALKVVILSRPLRDDAVDTALWNVADEQSVEHDLRRVLEVNGLRVGVITGELPSAVESVLKAQGPKRVEPTEILLPDGDHTMIRLSDAAPQVSLLLNLEGRAFGKDYEDASGWFHVTASQKGTNSVALRFVPELHHGPIRRGYTALPNPGSYEPHQFMQKDGQQEDMLRELAVMLTLQPGQIAVIGCRSEANRSLGSFLFTQAEANSDRLVQKALLVWATPSTLSQALGPPPVLPRLEPVEPPKQ
jgi:hypothetical protein